MTRGPVTMRRRIVLSMRASVIGAGRRERNPGTRGRLPSEAVEFRQGDATALDAAGGTFDWDYLKPQSRDGRRRTGRAVVGGLPAKPGIAALTAEQVAARARQAIAELQGRGLLLGPDCSINPDTPEALLRAAGAVRG